MKTKEEIEALALEKYPVEMFFGDGAKDDRDLNEYCRELWIEGYQACQSDQQPVDLEEIKAAWDKRSDYIKTKNVDTDEIFNFFKRYITQPAEDKEAFAVGFAKWIHNCVSLDTDENGVDVFVYNNTDCYDYDQLLHLYKNQNK